MKTRRFPSPKEGAFRCHPQSVACPAGGFRAGIARSSTSWASPSHGLRPSVHVGDALDHVPCPRTEACACAPLCSDPSPILKDLRELRADANGGPRSKPLIGNPESTITRCFLTSTSVPLSSATSAVPGTMPKSSDLAITAETLTQMIEFWNSPSLGGAN